MKSNNPFSIDSRHKPSNPEISRILSAAVINSQFRQLLLRDPIHAIHSGYRGERFSLDSTEQKTIASIKATTLAEFAAQLTNL
jgi:hypothetical protein